MNRNEIIAPAIACMIAVPWHFIVGDPARMLPVRLAFVAVFTWLIVKAFSLWKERKRPPVNYDESRLVARRSRRLALRWSAGRWTFWPAPKRFGRTQASDDLAHRRPVRLCNRQEDRV